MIYLFTGDDADEKRKAYENLLKSLDGEVLQISKDSFDRMQIESLYSGAGLFAPKFIIVFTGVLEYEEIRDFILDKLALLAESQSNFIFLEGKLLKPIIDSFKKARAEINAF
ncbi:MAG: hypothetical protein WD991_01075, partial [Candidatus Paceibacterota bacterium]